MLFLAMRSIVLLFWLLANHVNPFHASLSRKVSRMMIRSSQSSSTSSTDNSQLTESFDVVKTFLSSSVLGGRICLMDNQLRQEMQSSNFWTAGTFVINKCDCTRITPSEVAFKAYCTKQGKPCIRDITVPLPIKLENPDDLKTTLLVMAKMFDCVKESDSIVKLPIGKSYLLPLDFRFNDVPHAQWVRAYIYESVKNAVVKAIYDREFPQRNKMQVKMNFPEGASVFALLLAL